MIQEEEEEKVVGGGDDHNHRRIPDGLKEREELETLGSLEKDLPVELSFLIRQQAYCMARMNYLDRQIRELKESSKQTLNNITPSAPTNTRIPSSSHQSYQHHLYQHQHKHHNHHNHHHHQQQQNHNLQQQHQLNQRVNNLAINGIGKPTITSTTTNNIPMHQTNNLFTLASNSQTAHSNINKNGNFIPSDDSGGEYSRATISDDDELSSLLDQIAKSVKPPPIDNNNLNLQHLQQFQQAPMQQALPMQRATHYNVIAPTNAQPYAIFNPTLLQHHNHQAVPVFVMGSPITTTTATTTPANHPSSICSTILPGIHFQPEPRYNQYYATEDFYLQQNHSSTTSILNNNVHNALINRHHGGASVSGNSSAGLNGRSRQFNNSLSAIELLVSQKEKRQIKSQLKSADNWLKMRVSGLSNNLDFIPSTNSISGGSGTLVSTPAIPNSDNEQLPQAIAVSNGSASGSVIDKNNSRISVTASMAAAAAAVAGPAPAIPSTAGTTANLDINENNGVSDHNNQDKQQRQPNKSR